MRDAAGLFARQADVATVAVIAAAGYTPDEVAAAVLCETAVARVRRAKKAAP